MYQVNKRCPFCGNKLWLDNPSGVYYCFECHKTFTEEVIKGGKI